MLGVLIGCFGVFLLYCFLLWVFGSEIFVGFASICALFIWYGVFVWFFGLLFVGCGVFLVVLLFFCGVLFVFCLCVLWWFFCGVWCRGVVGGCVCGGAAWGA